MRAARVFAGTFYGQMRNTGNVGEAFRRAREEVVAEFEPGGDLSGVGAVLFGDAATGQRRDLALAEPPEPEPPAPVEIHPPSGP